MQPHLAKFLENNDSPSHEVLKEIKDLLSKPLQELQDKDAEIERLTKALDDLKEERNGIQKSIDEYATILSPIRRIPSDIMHEIFYHCLPTHRNPIMSITEAPLLLTRICQSWRSIALSSHRIWSRLHIPVLPHFSANASSYPQAPGPNSAMVWVSQHELGELYTRSMVARCKLAETWLSRSGSCPLSISLNFLGGVDCVSETDLDKGIPLLQLFNIILAYSPRCSDLEFVIPSDIFEILQSRLSPDMVPSLRNLKMRLYERPSHHTPSSKRAIILLQAPTLRSFSLSADNLMTFDSKTIPTTWENLTIITFNSAITGEEAVQVARRCKNLERCKLVISEGVDVYIGPEEILSLPRLRSLSIHLVGPDTMALFYRRIDVPILNSFEYQKYNQFPYTHTTEWGPVSVPQSPVLSLLEKCNSIKELCLDLHMLNAQDTLFSFRFSNQITHLILGQRPRNSSQWGSNWEHTYQVPSFSLDLLILGEDASSDPSIPEKEILLPKLEVFEAYGSPTNFSDKALQQFILGRLFDPARKEVSVLRVVKVVFDRMRETDIKGEVYRLAKQAGVEIELDLSYLAEPELAGDSKYIDIFSPWYGLSENDRSWNFADLETEGF